MSETDALRDEIRRLAGERNDAEIRAAKSHEDLAAALLHAEQAEAERDDAANMELAAREVAHCLSNDLAAARREWDRLRVLLLAAADWFDAIAQKVGRGQLGEAQRDAEGRATAYRAALEKANG